MTTTTTAASRYEQLSTYRSPVLQRARDASELTIPSLMPRSGTGDASKLPEPYQSTGADCVNNLSAKLNTALFPPGGGFFKLSVDPMVLAEIRAELEAQGMDPQDYEGEVLRALGQMERTVGERFEGKGLRIRIDELIKHLLVTGNGLLHITDDGEGRFFPLTQYVVKRDMADKPLEIIVKETVARVTLPPEIRAMLSEQKAEPANNAEPTVDVYTRIVRTESKWEIHQEVEGKIVPDSEGSYPLDKPAWLPLRWSKVSGSDYGRGRVEEYIGDFRSLEALAQSLIEFAAAASKHLIFVDPNGTTSIAEVANAPSGAVLKGNVRDITVLQLQKLADFQVVKAQSDETRMRLERSFLLASSVQRNAERVTAEEVRLMIAQLEQALGSVYSVLAEELQRPLIVRLLHLMEKKREIPSLPSGTLNPQIVTGLDGLGRTAGVQQLDTFLTLATKTLGPQVIAEWINTGAVMTRLGVGLGVSMDGLVRTEQEVSQARQQAAMQQATPELIRTVTRGAELQASAQSGETSGAMMS